MDLFYIRYQPYRTDGTNRLLEGGPYYPWTLVRLVRGIPVLRHCRTLLDAYAVKRRLYQEEYDDAFARILEQIDNQ